MAYILFFVASRPLFSFTFIIYKRSVTILSNKATESYRFVISNDDEKRKLRD